MRIVVTGIIALIGLALLLLIATFKAMIDAEQKWREEHDDFINK